MAHLADPNSVRKYLRLSPNEVKDEELDYYIERADDIVFQDVAIAEREEVLSGAIDGTNSTFSTRHKYIADTDFDCINSSIDVTVYGWGNKGELDTREKWGVSSINPDKGLIYLSSIPSSTYDVMTCNYYHYKNHPNWTILKRAANIWAAYDFIFAEYLLIPTKQRRGAVSWKHTKPYLDLKDAYMREINRFNQNITTKTKTKHMKMEEDYLDQY